MSTLNELIEQIDNPELRKRIPAEVGKLNKQKKFGLVFEEHLPECTPLYDIPVKKNSKVAKLDEKRNYKGRRTQVLKVCKRGCSFLQVL